MGRSDTDTTVVRIPPYHYIHVLDQNSNVSRLEKGTKGKKPMGPCKRVKG